MFARVTRIDDTCRRGVLLSAGAIALLGAYCQLHAAFDSGPVPIAVSMQWAAAVVLPWSMMGAWGWSRRADLLAAAAGPGRRVQAQLMALIWAAAQVTDLAAFALGRAGLFDLDMTDLAARAIAFAPVALLLAGALTTILALMARLRARSADGGAWISFPGHPQLSLRAGEIRLVRSAGNYCQLCTGERDHLVRLTLAEMADRLAPYGFVRVHRTAIVHPMQVREVVRATNGRTRLRLGCGAEIALGDRYRDALGSLTG